MTFFPKLAAFNISWSANPDRRRAIDSYVANPHTGKRGYLTWEKAENFAGSHQEFYREYLKKLSAPRLTLR